MKNTKNKLIINQPIINIPYKPHIKMNSLINVLQTDYEKHWDWDSISTNPNLTMGITENKSWDFEYISQNKFTFENIRIKKKRSILIVREIASFS